MTESVCRSSTMREGMGTVSFIESVVLVVVREYGGQQWTALCLVCAKQWQVVSGVLDKFLT